MKISQYNQMMAYLTRPVFKDGGVSMTPGAIKQRKYREKNPYKLKTTDIVVDGVKYTIPNNAMKPESAKGFIKFLNKLEKDPTIENYRDLVAGLDKDIANQIRNYRYYLQGEKKGAFIGRDGKETGAAVKKLFDEIKTKLPKKSTNFLSKIGIKEIKREIQKTRTAAAGAAAKGTSMDIVNAVRDIFVNDPNNAPSLDDIAEGLEGSAKWNAASEAEKIKMRTNASNATKQFLEAITGSRKVVGFKNIAPETLGDIIQYIDDNKRGEFRFAEGLIRDYKIRLRDSLIKGDFAKQRRSLRGQKGVIDEVFGLSATFENAPGYTENIQIISDKANKLKRTQIDKPFAAILKAVTQGRNVVQFDKQKNVPISEAIKKFNAKSKTFSNVNKISTPQIFVGKNLDATKLVSNFNQYSLPAQKNIKQLAKRGFVLNATKPSTPIGTFLQKAGVKGKALDTVLKGVGATVGGAGAASAADGTETTSMLPTAAGAGAGAAAIGTKTGRNILGRTIGGAFGPTGLFLMGAGTGGYDLRDPLGRATLAAEAAFAPDFVRGTIGATKGMKNRAAQKIAQRALNLGLSVPQALRLARIASPLGIAALGAEALFGYGKFVKSELDRIKAMTPEEREQYNAAEQEQMGIAAAGGGLLKQAGDRSGKPPEAGPTPQGLDFLLKRVRQS